LIGFYVVIVLLIVRLIMVPAPSPAAVSTFSHRNRGNCDNFTTSSDLQWGAACDQGNDNDTGTENTDCPVAGSRCGYTSAASAADTQCCTASPDNYDGFNFCTRMPTGAACWSNPMCASNSCQNIVMQQSMDQSFEVAPGVCE
jgi:hypothetical protein